MYMTMVTLVVTFKLKQKIIHMLIFHTMDFSTLPQGLIQNDSRGVFIEMIISVVKSIFQEASKELVQRKF